jgi:very-short-patch-repair endonuclease
MSVDLLLARQSGLISRAQALAAGLTPAAVDERVRTRRWHPVHPRVYLADGHGVDAATRMRAAMLWAGPDAVLSGLAAAWWHGLVPEPPAEPTVTTPGPRRSRGRPGVRVHHRRLGAVDRAVCRGVAVTAVPLTVLDAAVELGAAASGPFLDRVLRARVPFPSVDAARGRGFGEATAALLLAATADRAGAAAERDLATLLRRGQVRGWRRGAEVAGHRIGVAFPRSRVAVEAAGWAWHTDPLAVRRAARRRDDLAAAGWDLVPIAWDDLRRYPRDVLTRVAAAAAAP